MSCYGKILARYLADTGMGAGFILVTMIIGTGLYRPGRGFFFVTDDYIMVHDHDNYKWSPGWQLCARMTIFDYYVLKWWKFGQFVFLSFFGNGSCSSRSRSTDDVCGFSLLQCLLVASSSSFSSISFSCHSSIDVIRGPAFSDSQGVKLCELCCISWDLEWSWRWTGED